MSVLRLVFFVLDGSTGSVSSSFHCFFFLVGSLLDLLDKSGLSCFNLCIILSFFCLSCFFLSLLDS
jgi:hypothetical protein